MATRIWLPSSGAAPVTPSTWNFAALATSPLTLAGQLFRTSTALTTKTEPTGTTSPILKGMFRWVIGPLSAQTITGTIKGQIIGDEANAGANANPALAIKIITPAGADRAVLLAATGADANTAGNEFTTSMVNMKFMNASEVAAIPLTSGTATAGDYLVIEVGFRSATTVSRNIDMRYGTSAASDLPEDTSTTTDLNPWIEFSQTITFADQAVTTLNIGSTAVLNPAYVTPDVLVANISTATARGLRSIVFPSELIGYVFYLNSTGVFGYSKTTDGGATWGAHVAVDGTGATTTVVFDIWFDRWTPADAAGNLIHCWWFDTTNSITRYRNLNISNDTLGTQRNIFVESSAVAGRGAFISGTKTRSGYLYVAYDIDAGAERGFRRSTDGGTTWTQTNLSTSFVEATLDTCKLYPASGTGDDNDCWALYYDASALELTLKLWDSSAVSAVESAMIGVAHTDGPTDLTGQYGYDGVVRHSDGHLIVAALSGRDVAASQHQVFDITSTSVITTKTAIAASTDDHYYPQVFINLGTNTIFVAYNGKRDGSEVLDTTTKVYYTYSTNGGTTWNAGDATYMDGAAVAVQQVWNGMSGSRFYCVWRVGNQLWGNKVNSLVQLGAQGVTITSTAVLYVPIVGNTQLITGATVASTLVVNVPSVSGGALPTGPDLLTGLREYWSFDEVSGDALGELGLTNLLEVGTAASVSGKINGGRVTAFGGARFITSVLPVTALPMTVSLWINPSNVSSTNQNIVGMGTNVDNNNAWTVYFQGGYLRFYNVHVSGAYVDVGGSTYCPVDTWAHLLLVWRSSTDFEIFLNGVSEIVGSVSYAPNTDQTRFVVGTFAGGVTGDNFGGVVDEGGVWAIAFDTDQVAAIYNDGDGVDFDNLGGGGGPSDKTVLAAFLASASTTFAPVVVLPGGVQSIAGATLLSGVVLNAPTVRRAGDLTDQMVGHWPMNQAGALDPGYDVHHGNVLTTVGSAQAGQNAIDGTPARDFEFTGSPPTSMSAPANSDLSFNGSWSAIVRYKFESTAAGGTFDLIAKGTEGSNLGSGGFYWYNVVGGFRTWVNNSGSGLVNADFPIALTVGTTYVIAGGWDSVRLKAWIRVNNGTRVEVDCASSYDGANTFLIGAYTTTAGVGQRASQTDGAIGPVSLWHRNITDADIDAWIAAKGNYVSIGGAYPTVYASQIASTAVLNAPTVVSGLDLTPAMVSHWPTDESTFVSARDQFGTNPLSIRGSDTGAQTPIDGTPARELEAGVDNVFMSAIDAASLAFSSDQAFTFITRMKLEEIGVGFEWFSKYSTTAPGNFQVFADWESGSGFGVQIFNNAGSASPFVQAGPTSLTVGATYIVAFGYDPVTDKLWIRVNNGARVQGTWAGGTSSATSSRLILGSSAPTIGPATLDGAVGPATLWKRSLSEAEIDYWISVKGDGTAIGVGKLQSISTVAIATTLQQFAPTVAVGPVDVTTPNLPATNQLFALSVAPGAVVVGGVHIPTTVQLNAPSITTGPISITTGTIASVSIARVPSVAPGPVAVLAATIATVAMLFVPSVAVGAVTVGVSTVLSSTQLFTPSVAPGPAVVTLPFISSTATMFVPSVVPSVTITLAHRPTTIQVFAPSVTVGPVTVLLPAWVTSTQLFAPAVTVIAAGDIGLAHIPSTVQMYAPTVATGAITIVGGHRPTTIQCFAPSLALNVTGATISSGSQCFVPIVFNTQLVALVKIVASNVLFSPFVSYQIQLPTCPSGALPYPPTVGVGPATVVLPFIQATSQCFAPFIGVGVTNVGGGTISTTEQVFPPFVAMHIALPFIVPTLQVAQPSVSLNVTLSFIASTVQLIAPAVAPVVTVPFIGSTGQLFPPLVVQPVLTAFIGSKVVLYGPTVEPEVGDILVGGIGPNSRVFPPHLARVFPPGTCLVSRLTVQYLVTSQTIDCMMMATGTVQVRYSGMGTVTVPTISVTGSLSVRYPVSSDGVHACCLETVHD